MEAGSVEVVGFDDDGKIKSTSKTLPAEDGASLPSLVLQPAVHQVAGHGLIDGRPGPLVDDSGRRFFKPLKEGDYRADREIAFYNKIKHDKSVPSHVQEFFPAFYGTTLLPSVDGQSLVNFQRHGVMENLTYGYKKPAVADFKIGYKTWYPEATEEYKKKQMSRNHQDHQENASLSAWIKPQPGSSMMAGLFCHDVNPVLVDLLLEQVDSDRLSGKCSRLLREMDYRGVNVYEASTGATWRPERKWLRDMSVEMIRPCMERYVSFNPSDENPDATFSASVYGGPDGVLAKLEQLTEWFSKQTSYHFSSTSVLIVYESSATTTGHRNVAVKLIDFAHATDSDSIDENFLSGLKSFASVISGILEEHAM